MNWFSVGVALVLVLLAGYYLLWVRDYGRELLYRRSKKSRLPPGNLGFPLVGETLHLIHSLRSNYPQQFYNERVRKFGHVFKTSLVGHRTVVVTGPTGNRLLLSNENKLFVASWPSSLTKLTGQNSLVSKSGDEYRHLRAGIMGFLNPEALQKHVGKMSFAIRENLCSGVRHDDRPVKAVALMKRLVVSVVSSLFFNVQEKHAQKQLCDILDAIILGTACLPVNLPGTQYRRAMDARSKLDEIISCLVQKRRIIYQSSSSSDPDLLSILMAYKDQSGNPLQHCEILDNISFLLQAGFDTTVSVLTMMLKMLSSHQDCFQQLVKEQMQIYHSKSQDEELTWDDTRKMSYTWQVAQETMRMFPPVLGSFRKAITDVQFGGYIIPKGWKFHWTVHSTHMREEYFTSPLEFKPERFNENSLMQYTYLPFGGGLRVCAGIEFSRMEILLVMHHFVTAYASFSPMDPQENITYTPMPLPVNGFPIKLFPRGR